jgi:endoglucanase
MIARATGFYVKDQKIYDDNHAEFRVKGLSWFGFETPDHVVNGLWVHPMEYYFSVIKEHGINVLRIPFSAEWIFYNFDQYPYDGNISQDPSIRGKSSIQILDRLFDLAKQNGVFIMLDLHRLHKEYISELWYSPYDNQYTWETYFATWFRMLDRYKDHPSLFAVDLLNEPHGKATWGTGDESTDWKLFVERALPEFKERYPDSRWLYFVEGINWGKDLSGYLDHPLNTEIPDRIVFSPHNYGKSVVPDINMDVQALHRDWDYHFGYLKDLGQTFAVGEWGGKTDLDTDWMSLFVDYLIEKGMTNNFLWSLGPNSGDVAGLLGDDWSSIDVTKLNLLNKLN